jgi:sugar/nucleoside kinase (ribokinase family)
MGVGGIGTGIIIALDGDHNLGRTESRMGRLLEARDYCKLHIVEHNLAALLRAAARPAFCRVAAVGNVGADDAGASLLQQMSEAGIDTSHVHVEPEYRTLFSVSFLYPDKSGGNITIENSAASMLDHAHLESCRKELGAAGRRGIALCLPEVPLRARAEFLRIATDCGSYRVASFTSGEMKAARDLNLLSRVDLLALNREEAAALAGAESGEGDLLEACLHAAVAANPDIRLMVSAGSQGVQVFDQGAWSHHPAVPVEVVSSAGAGDALLAGVIAGIVQGLPLAARNQEHEPTALDLGLLAAAFSLTSPHTIHPGLSAHALQEFAESQKTRVAGGEATDSYAGMESSRRGR